MKFSGVTIFLVIFITAIVGYFAMAFFQATISEPIYNEPKKTNSVPASLGINFNTTITAYVPPTEFNTPKLEQEEPQKDFQLITDEKDIQPPQASKLTWWQKIWRAIFGDN